MIRDWKFFGARESNSRTVALILGEGPTFGTRKYTSLFPDRQTDSRIGRNGTMESIPFPLLPHTLVAYLQVQLPCCIPSAIVGCPSRLRWGFRPSEWCKPVSSACISHNSVLVCLSTMNSKYANSRAPPPGRSHPKLALPDCSSSRKHPHSSGK